MASLTIPKAYNDGQVLLESDLDGALDSISTFLNTTKLNDDNIQDGGITGSTKLLTASVSEAKLATGAVTTTKLADSSVTTAKIVDANVTLAKMAANSIDSDQYVDGSIDREHLAVGSVALDSVSGVKTTTYTALTSEDVIRCSTTGGGWTLTLPAASSGRKITVRKTTSDFNVLTISGVTTLNTDGECVVLEYDGAAWFVVSRYIPSNWIGATLTAGGAGITAINSQNTFIKRVGDSLAIKTTLNLNVAAGAGYFVLPSSLTMDTTKYVSNQTPFGAWWANQLNNQYGYDGTTARLGAVMANTTNANQLMLANRGASSTMTEIAAYNAIIGSGQSIAFECLVPISGWNG